MPAEILPACWQDLFGSKHPDAACVVRIVSKSDHPFLLLPIERKEAATALQLYPAQTLKARMASKVLKFALRSRLPLPLRKNRLQYALGDDFVVFLRSLVNTSRLPPFAMLMGNPKTGAARIVIMLFDANHRPGMIVKTGASPEARKLVVREQKFLQSVPGDFGGVPRVCAVFSNERFQAFALDYLEGVCPSPAAFAEIGLILTQWLDRDRMVRLGECPSWKELIALASDARVHELTARLSHHQLRPTLYHGDFAPWNIRVRPTGEWIPLDWERGELVGIPGWDWFHYVVQTAVLVERSSVTRIIAKIEALIRSETFRECAAAASIAGIENDLLLAYLFNCTEVVRQTEGAEKIREVIRAFGYR